MFLLSPGWPSRRVWILGAAMAALSLGLIFLGTVGQVVLVAIVVIGLFIGANRRVGAIDPDEEFRNSRPDK